MRWVLGSRVALLAYGACVGTAWAQAGAALSADAGSGAPGDAGAGAPVDASGSCVEDLGRGGDRPKLTDSFPERGQSGYVATLKVVVEHGRGETVLPNGLRFHLGGDQVDALEKAGFALPNPLGSAGPSLAKTEQGTRVTTTVSIPFVALPPKGGRHSLTLPPLPISIARASGEIIRLCTQPHTVTVDEPIANLSDPAPRGNPEPRSQIEEWTTLKHVTYASAAALAVGALVSWLVLRWLRRPRPAVPPPPPRPPWEVAIEELHDIRYAGLVEAQRYDEHYDRVSHSMRKYLGGRFGFDGLETTTREMILRLRRVVPAIPVQPEIEVFLREADLVKFARLTPSQDQCSVVLERGESIVRMTMPAALPPAESPPAADPSTPVAPTPGTGASQPNPGGPGGAS